jgi:MoaA/NifB/PqqE/SkfB family radical SAM enzyme
MPARHFDNISKHPAYPVMMEFLVSNQCNLECVMCEGQYSSLIRKNRDKLPPIPTVYDEAFLAQLEEFIPYLQEARFSGSGEAFMIDMNYDIWEMIIKRNPECLIVVQTNGTILSARVKDMLSRGRFQIGISVDSLKKDVFESIRLNANFDKLMENIAYFHEYSVKNKRKFTISTCVMQQNWSELPEFVRFCNSLNAVATFHKVWFPRQHALRSMHWKQLENIVQTLSWQDFPSITPREKQNKAHYEYMLFTIEQWMQQAKENEGEQADIDHLAEDELAPYLRQKLERYFAGIEENGLAAAAVDECMDKFTGLVAQFPGPQKEHLMRQFCMIAPNETGPALQKQSLEFLTAEAKKFLG